MPTGVYKRSAEWTGKAQFWFNKEDMEIILDGLSKLEYSDDYKEKLTKRIQDEYDKRHAAKTND